MIKIGILGAARIAPKAVIFPASVIGNVEIAAVGASTIERAEAFAQFHHIPKSLTYDGLLADPDIDVIYNPLPPHLHAPWTIKALEAGKHVLLEKPSAPSSAEVLAMQAAAATSGKRLIEAFHYCYHPLFVRALEIMDSGVLGAIKSAEAVFDTPIKRDPSEFRWQKAYGGGALADLGCYCTHWLRTLLGAEPEVISATQWHENDGARENDGVDRATEAFLTFGDIPARLHTDMAPKTGKFLAYVKIEGADGTLFLDNPLCPQDGHELVLTTKDGEMRQTFPRATTFFYQMVEVVKALETGGAIRTEGLDMIGNIVAMEKINQAAVEG